MKKLLLTGAFALASFLTAQAQATYSFETSEGYTVGDLAIDEEGNGQNEWGTNTPYAQIIDTDATEGSNSLFIGNNNTALGSGVTVGAYGPSFTAVDEYAEFSFDVKVSAVGTGTATFSIAAQAPSQEMATSRLTLTNDGRWAYFDIDPEDETALAGYYLGTVDGETFTAFTAAAETWYHVRIVHDFTGGVVSFYVNGTLYGQSSAWGADAIENVIFLTNNLNSNLTVDNVIVNNEVAGLNNNQVTQFSVFPNPANDIVTVAAGNALVNNVSIVDINGRTVKSVKFDSLANAQINVSDLAKGVYVMTISSDKGVSTQKIMKN